MAGRYPRQHWLSGVILSPYGPLSGERLEHYETWLTQIFDDFDNHLITGNAHPVYILKPGSPVTNGAIVFDGANYISKKITKDEIAAGAGILKSQLESLGIVNADVAAGAAISGSKLALDGLITNAMVATGAAIAKSKLNLTGEITDGDIAPAAAIVASKLAGYPADGTKVHAGDGTWKDFGLGVWQGYQPSLTASTTNPTLGNNPTREGRYTQIGKTVYGWAKIAFGDSGVNPGSGAYSFSIPAAPYYNPPLIGNGRVFDVSGNIQRNIILNPATGANVSMSLDNVAGGGPVTNAIPWTWAAYDFLQIQFAYEVA